MCRTSMNIASPARSLSLCVAVCFSRRSTVTQEVAGSNPVGPANSIQQFPSRCLPSREFRGALRGIILHIVPRSRVPRRAQLFQVGPNDLDHVRGGFLGGF